MKAHRRMTLWGYSVGSILLVCWRSPMRRNFCRPCACLVESCYSNIFAFLCLHLVVFKRWFFCFVFLGQGLRFCTRLCSFPRMGITCPFRAFGRRPHLERGYAFYLTSTYSCLASLTIQPFQDLDELLRSLLSTERPSSNLTKTWKHSGKYTLTLSPPKVM